MDVLVDILVDGPPSGGNGIEISGTFPIETGTVETAKTGERKKARKTRQTKFTEFGET